MPATDLAIPLDKPLAADRITPPRRTLYKRSGGKKGGVSYGTDLKRPGHP